MKRRLHSSGVSKHNQFYNTVLIQGPDVFLFWLNYVV